MLLPRPPAGPERRRPLDQSRRTKHLDGGTPGVTRLAELPDAPGINLEADDAPHPIVTEEGAEADGKCLSTADICLTTVYGDYPHANDGCHLHGGAPNDPATQKLWKRVVQLSQPHYYVPQGKVGRQFIVKLASLFRGVRERKHNSEQIIIFVAVVL